MRKTAGNKLAIGAHKTYHVRGWNTILSSGTRAGFLTSQASSIPSFAITLELRRRPDRILADERTFLTYVRTLPALVLVGARVIRIFEDPSLNTIGWTLD
ncbi:MAG: DUF202 domain-containing protein [Spirochaetota bacterium]